MTKVRQLKCRHRVQRLRTSRALDEDKQCTMKNTAHLAVKEGHHGKSSLACMAMSSFTGEDMIVESKPSSSYTDEYVFAPDSPSWDRS